MGRSLFRHSDVISAGALVTIFFLSACGSESATRAQGESVGVKQSQTVAPDESTDDDLGDYIGSYDGREITLSGSTLSYFREGMPMPAALKNIAEDHFEVVIPPGAQVRGPVGGQVPTFRFNRDDSGDVESMTLVNPDGTEVATFKKG